MVNKTFLPSAITPAKHLTLSKTVAFQTGTAFAEYSVDHGLGRAWAVREISGPAWESSTLESMKGRTTDGEYASRRTIAADGAGTADGCRRQQRRQHQHQRLQGRP